jgi:hypothetical protein
VAVFGTTDSEIVAVTGPSDSPTAATCGWVKTTRGTAV